MNDHACKEFCKHVSDTFRADVIDSLSTAKFISIIADGATDVSCLEEEIVYVRFVSGGAPKTCYVELAEVENAKASGILKAIKSVMDKIDPQWMQKLMSTGTDSAPVMMGKIGGVVSLIKQDAPQVIGIHCVAYNLELAFSDTLKSNETMMSIKELLNGCWKHYKYSPKALREQREMAEATEIKVGKPTKASGTRWVPHLLRALAVLLQKNFPGIVSHFEHTAEARDSSAEMQGRGRNLAEKLKAYKFQLHLHLLWDMVEEISKMSLIFQKDAISISQVKAEIEQASQALKNMRRRPGRHNYCCLSRRSWGWNNVQGDQTYKEQHR
ncbi:zinc finger protein 862-like [Montipora capricornis]|uniref:zinc finger protein 862-like n=1 Tax=Montipora capricornis TaxID=246305 RepID=UPI0035F161F1